MNEIIKILKSIKDQEILSFEKLNDNLIMVLSNKGDRGELVKFTFIDDTHKTKEAIIYKINNY